MYEDLVNELMDIHAVAILNRNTDVTVFSRAAAAIRDLSAKYLKSEVDATNLTGWLAEESAKNYWRSVKGSLPWQYEKVLTSGEYGIIRIAYLNRERQWLSANGWDLNDITHWMPLPEPPKEET